MQRLMSDLLAGAAGKQEFRAPGVTCHPESFIVPGEYRREHCTTPDQDRHSPTHHVRYYAPSDSEYPSYVPCYDVSGYASSPTYVRGDYYNLSPPESPEVKDAGSTGEDESSRKQGLSFSIDSILATATHEDMEVTDSTPARVYSDVTTTRTQCSSGQFRFSMTDWPAFQRVKHRPTQHSSRDDGKVFWCHVCDMTCPTTEVATSHREDHVTKGDNCRLQRKHFATHGYVSTHEETDYLNRIKCGLCGKIVTRCFFHKHMQRHDGHVCDVCGHEASTNRLLLQHKTRHHGVAASDGYPCGECSRIFGDRAQLTRHALSHRTAGHQCRFCGKTFGTKYTRVVHERIHTGSNPYVCTRPGCSRSFPQKVQLQIHRCGHE